MFNLEKRALVTSCSHGLRTFARDLAMQSCFSKHVSALFFLCFFFFCFLFSVLCIMIIQLLQLYNFSFFSFPSDLLLIKTVMVVSSSCYCCNSRWSVPVLILLLCPFVDFPYLSGVVHCNHLFQFPTSSASPLWSC